MMQSISKVIFVLGCSFIFASLWTFSGTAQAETKEEMFSFLQEAYEAQLSLGETHRSWQEVEEVLHPFFTPEFTARFADDHLFHDENGYISLGTDFFITYIPFYSYDDRTNVAYDRANNRYLIYEFFPAQYEGPVTWDDHYEVLTVNDTSEGWKISDLQYREDEPTHSGLIVTIDGETQDYQEEPFIEKGHTFVPLRAIFEQLGTFVSWDASNQQITAEDGHTLIELEVGSTQASVNGQAVEIEAVPVIKEGRTFVPLRFVSEAFGASVSWNRLKQEVSIQTLP
ncbi:DUF3993 domain-containing protein [Desertibacillus haloalkaliphilus]|uniref:DUF3993 domain-containing protein n=1 Tax=Desertibacillus haloalkaliphilus TaxID=1328930 RepID=UPI001C2638FC|nr:DUF3993 domain-containing protein [Desertibacillus haloalkaliphilus]MBU8908016.1 DUF3993 domain-containing protein [Desertibacillus haloalkaliphilus]